MRHFIVVAMLAAGLSLPGCIYVPPIWDNADEIHKVDQIEEGTTTREEVLNLLGEPDSERENVFYYSESTSDGYIIYGTPYIGPAYAGLIDKESWWIDITFDENGVVRELSSSVDLLAKREQTLRARAEQGDAEAQYELVLFHQRQGNRAESSRWIEELVTSANAGDAEAQYQLSRYYFFQNEDEKFIRFRCLAANGSQPYAQFSLARSYNFGARSYNFGSSQFRDARWLRRRSARRPDIVQAHMWYALATSNGHSFSSENENRLAEQMTPEQFAEAERLVAEWKPDPSSCEVEAASSS